MQELSGRAVKLDVIAGEAHWQRGVTERMIHTITDISENVRKEAACVVRHSIRRAVTAHNTVHDAHGYSPSQWAFGRQPRWAGDLWITEDEEDVPLAKMSNPVFMDGLKKQKIVEDAARTVQAQRVMTRAKNASHRRHEKSSPSELVYAWRQGKRESSQGHSYKHSFTGVGPRSGQWFGPAVVLATEARVMSTGHERGSIVWITINGRL